MSTTTPEPDDTPVEAPPPDKELTPVDPDREPDQGVDDQDDQEDGDEPA